MRHRSRFRFLLFLMALVAPEIPFLASVPAAEAQPAKLQFQSICVLGTPNEYFTVYNPGNAAVDLSDYYVSDAIFTGEVYAYIVDPATRTPEKAGGGGMQTDFHVRFPSGAMIASHDTIAVGVQGAAAFMTTYGRKPAFEIIASGAGDPDVPNMLEAFPGSIPTGAFGLSNGTESLTIYYWNGQTDLVTDVDYVVWGNTANTPNFEVNKTGLSLDGPDADTTPTTYQPDTAPAQQLPVLGLDGSSAHMFGNALRREDYTDASQRSSGGNGIGGTDETSENLESTWSNSNPAAPSFVKGNQPALLTARPGGPYTGTVGAAVTFSGAGSTPAEGGTITNYAWTFGDGGNGTGPSPTHAYTTAGTFTVTLTVTGSAGGTSSATTTATIAAEATLTARPGGPYSGTVGNPISFSGAASTPASGGTITNYAWTFGDGGSGTGATTTHTYAAAGAFTVMLTVTGSAGGTHSATTTATVTTGGGGGGPAKKLLFQTVCVTGSPQEYIAIYNPNNESVDLSNYYITDSVDGPSNTNYAYLVNRAAGIAGGGGFSDFNIRFPAGATIAAHDTIAVGHQGAPAFITSYGRKPAYEVAFASTSDGTVPDMLPAFPGSISSVPDSTTLTNGGESVVLYFWDGQTDLVTDIDYVIWGATSPGRFVLNKTGLSVDGPDADTTPTAYKPDTPAAGQVVVAAAGHTPGNAFRREDFNEGTQKKTGGNGVDGSDETSENLSTTWSSDKPAAPPFVKGGTPPPPGQLTAVPGGPYTGFVGAAIAFNGSGSTAATGQTIAAYEWTFGDGGTGTGSRPSHTYTNVGTFTVTLTVRGSTSGTHTASTTATISNPSQGALQIAARTFIPTLNEIFPVTVDVPTGSEITLRIFDLEGREVKTLFDGVSAGKVTYNWDGRDAQLMLVSAGTLICHLEIRNKSGGVENHQAPIVVARKLERN